MGNAGRNCRAAIEDGESGQGIYLWEHRHRGGKREIVVHIGN